MLVIKLRTIVIILFVVVVVIMVGAFEINNISIVTSATPATNKTVILDAGHGVPEDGICLNYFLRM